MALDGDLVDHRTDLIGLVRSLVSEEGFNPDEFVLAGSARLLHDGIIDSISDVDLVARGKTLRRAFKLSRKQNGRGVPRGENTGDKIASLYGGKVNVSARWLPGHGVAARLIRNADVIDGLRYFSITRVIEYKQTLGRPKDHEHLAAIEATLGIPNVTLQFAWTSSIRPRSSKYCYAAKDYGRSQPMARAGLAQRLGFGVLRGWWGTYRVTFVQFRAAVPPPPN